MQRWRHFSFSISWTFKRFEMGSIGNPKVINRVVNVLYNIGFWHQGDIPTARELRSKLFYGIYYSLFVLSTVVGGIINEEIGKQVFLLEALLISSVLFIKFGFLIWNQRRILDLLHRIGTFSVRNDNLVEILNGKLGGFSKCLYALIAAEAITCLEVIIIPFVGSEQNLFLEIAFPWDYKNSEIAYWAAHIFVLVATVLSMLITILSMIIWYLLLSCSLRYTILDSELKKIGQMGDEIKVSKKMRHNMYARDLIECVVVHLHTKEYENDVSPSELVTHSLQYFDRLTDELGSFLSEIFFIQFGTSGLCICASIYCLIFNVGDNLVERCLHLIVLYYCLSELFWITYLGNEIMLSSNRLSYSLFESEWTEQPQITKNCVVIFGEYLKQPHELVVCQLYPLTLKTFIKILNSAYSMFNILKEF